MTLTEIAYFLLKFVAWCVVFIGLASVFCGHVTWLGVAACVALVVISCVALKDGKAVVEDEPIKVEIDGQ